MAVKKSYNLVVIDLLSAALEKNIATTTKPNLEVFIDLQMIEDELVYDNEVYNSTLLLTNNLNDAKVGIKVTGKVQPALVVTLYSRGIDTVQVFDGVLHETFSEAIVAAAADFIIDFFCTGEYLSTEKFVLKYPIVLDASLG